MAEESEHIVELKRALGQRLADLRKAAAVTQGDVARHTFVDRTYVSHAERGQQMPTERSFWVAADEYLGANGCLSAAFDELVAAQHQVKQAELDALRARHRAPSSPARQQEKPRGGRYALIITMSRYQDPVLNSLDEAETDGRNLADVLENPSVGGYTCVPRLHNSGGHAARRAVRDFFRSRTKDDLALVYFSGHGLKEGNSLYFATSDADPSELQATTIPANLIAEEASKSKCGQVVVILDCCFGSAFSRGDRMQTAEDVQPVLRPIVSRRDFVLISATRETEFVVVAQPDGELRRTGSSGTPSPFTDIIIEGLNSGEVDKDGDGKITPRELFSYLSRRLRKERDPKRRPLIVDERGQDPIVIAMSQGANERRALPADIESMLADRAALSAGLGKLLDYDEQQGGRQRPVVVKKLTSLPHAEDDVTAREEIAQALAKLAQRPIPINDPPRRRAQRRRRRVTLTVSLVAMVAVLAATAATARQLINEQNDIQPVAGEITIAGSSTVEPVIRRAAEKFRSQQPDTHFGISGGGTGSGFDAFCAQQSVTDGIDLVDASRPITVEEVAACGENGVKHERFHLGYDGLSVVTSNENGFLEHLTFEQLRMIFGRPNLQSWQQFDSSFPNEPIKICAPGAHSGTFDFFVEKVFSGDVSAFRDAPDDVRSEVDPELVQCVQANPFAIGFFGHAFYAEHASMLKALAITEDPRQRPELPTEEAVLTNLYPLARPLFVYARVESINTKPQVAEFLRFLFREAERVVRDVGYFPAYGNVYNNNLAKIDGLT